MKMTDILSTVVKRVKSYVDSSLTSKVDSFQGTDNTGKMLHVDDTGHIASITISDAISDTVKEHVNSIDLPNVKELGDRIEAAEEDIQKNKESISNMTFEFMNESDVRKLFDK